MYHMIDGGGEKARNIRRGLMLLLCFSFGVIASGESGDDLIKNGSFEEGLQEWKFTQYKGAATCALDDQVKHDRAKSLKLICTQEGESFVDIDKDIQVYPGTKYTLSFWVKKENAKPGDVEANVVYAVAINENDGEKNVRFRYQSLIQNRLTNDWQRYERKIVTAENAKKIHVRLYIRQPGTLWYDDVSLKEEPGQVHKPAGLTFVKPHLYYMEKQITLDFDFTRAPFKPSDADVKIIGKSDQKIIREKSLKIPAGLKASVTFDIPDIAPGEYDIQAVARGPDGKTLPGNVITEKITWPEKPWWLGSQAGISDKVLPPWTDLKMDRMQNMVTVQPWGRSYEFNGKTLINQIVTKGVSMLKEPVQIHSVVDGKAVEWDKGAVEIVETTPAKISLIQTSVSKKLKMTAKTTIEYDGMIRLDWKLEPTESMQLDEMTFKVSLDPQYAKYLYYIPRHDNNIFPWYFEPDSTNRHRPGLLTRDRKMGFTPILWFGDEERGLQWFAESDKNWYNNKPENAIEISKGNETVTLKLNLVNVPIRMDPKGQSSEQRKMADPAVKALADLSYTFGFEATPVKPVSEDLWDYKFDLDYSTGKGRRLPNDEDLDKMVKTGNKSFVIWIHIADIMGHYQPYNSEAFKTCVNACKSRGLRVLQYLCAWISDLNPEWPYLGEECLMMPRQSEYNPASWNFAPEQYAAIFCEQSVWQDFLVSGIAKNMETFKGIGGVYIDSNTILWNGCENIRHGCGYMKPDNSVGRTYPLFAIRNLMKRVYTVVKTANPEAQIKLHQSGYMNASAMAWATSYFEGEHLWTLKNDYMLDVLPLDMFRTEFMGHQWGIPAEFIWSGLQKCTTFNQQLSLTLLHDVPICGVTELWPIFDEFKKKEAEYLPYWKNAEYVQVKPEGAYASLYKHPKNGVIAIVSNLARETNTVVMTFDLGKLGLANKPIKVLCPIDKQTLDMQGNVIQFELHPLGWKLLWIKPDGKK